MTTLDPAALDPQDLVAMLLDWTAGLYADEAAVGLLASHGTWLRRTDFLSTCVDAIADGWTDDGPAPLASIDWRPAARFADHHACSTSEASILRLACSLVGLPVGDLATLTRSLDPANLVLLLEAIAHRAGWHERAVTHLVTGKQFCLSDHRQSPQPAAP